MKAAKGIQDIVKLLENDKEAVLICSLQVWQLILPTLKLSNQCSGTKWIAALGREVQFYRDHHMKDAAMVAVSCGLIRDYGKEPSA